MSAADYLRELAFPLRSAATVIALLTFALLLGIASMAGRLGIWLFIVTAPAYSRYLTMIAEARAYGKETAPPGIEIFSLLGSVWSLFPAVLALAMGALVVIASASFGVAVGFVMMIGVALLWPAMVGVLVITQSPLQSLNPAALSRFVTGCGTDFWYAPMTAVLIVAASGLLGAVMPWTVLPVDTFLIASLFAVTGAVMRRGGLIEDVGIPESIEPDSDKVTTRLQRDRIGVLNHAYGFTSRGNRDGGLAHVVDWLGHDPDPDEAWPWFFEQMTRWENTMPALLLAQQYLGRLLDADEQVRAVKLMLRCRIIDDGFRPLPADRPRAIEAARACRNDELEGLLGG